MYRRFKKPNWNEVCEQMPKMLQFLVPFEYCASWFFYAFNNIALVRFAIEFSAAAAIIFGVWGIFKEAEHREFERFARATEREERAEERRQRANEQTIRQEETNARAEERIQRMWDLATDPRPGNSGKIPSLEFLNLNGHPLTGISIPKPYLSGINLAGANLKDADLSGADIGQANLSRSNLEGARLIRTKLRKTDLSEVILINAHLGGADLTGANLSEANLDGANLSEASFYGASLHEASLREVDLNGADLSGADISGADLSGADFLHVRNLAQNQLDGACGNPPRNLPDGLVWNRPLCPKF